MFGFKKKEKINTDQAKIERLLSRNIEEIFVKENLLKKLQSGEQLRVKLGFDPTSNSIHIGRAITLRKLKEFQDLGHKIVFLVGNFTAQIGDPSDKLEKRPTLTEEQIEKNLKDYIEIAGKIIDTSKIEVVYNADWLSKLNFKEIAELADSFTVSQMTSRRNFKERLERGDEVSLREFLYPIMQGYDSVAVDADVEIGGFDQLFNLKAGRVVQKFYNKPVQDVLTTVMLEGTDGRKMSSSWGNVINITDSPDDMYGKIMSLKDELIPKYFIACTNVSDEEYEEIKKDLNDSNKNPKDIKMRLAKEIVTIYHDSKKAKDAEDNFVKTFGEGLKPDEIKEIKVSKGSKLSNTLVSNNLVESNSEFKRLINSGAIRNLDNDSKIEDIEFIIESEITLKIGKRRFVRIGVES